MYRELLEEAKTMEADLIAWRRKLHTMPELGLELPDTSTFVREKLEEMGIPYEIKVNGSCVVGILGKGSRCFMLRSDMDGLPFQEESGEGFRRQHIPGTSGLPHAWRRRCPPLDGPARLPQRLPWLPGRSPLPAGTEALPGP